MKRARMTTVVASILLATCSIRVWAVAADPDGTGITVSATGEAKVKPSRLEIEIKASAAAELTSDAVVKYHDALKHAKEAFEKLKIDNLTIEDQGVSVSSNGGPNEEGVAMPNPSPATGSRVKQEVGISKSLRLKVTGIDKMSEEEVVALTAKLLDVARDSGLTAAAPANSMIPRVNGMVIANPMVTFYADDAPGVQQKASDDAFDQAKAKAQRLATKAGVQLGPVLSIDEIAASSSERTPTEQIVLMILMSEMGGYEPMAEHLTSYTLAEMPVHVNLRVRFAIQPAGASK